MKIKNLLIIVLIIIGISSLFIWLVMPSELDNAYEKLRSSNDLETTRLVWKEFKNSTENDLEFKISIAEKLEKQGLSESEFGNFPELIAVRDTVLNVVVIPDLSSRIKDTINNPSQIQGDIQILDTTWRYFLKRSRRIKRGYFSFDLTDREQASGKFTELADKLQFDFSNQKGNNLENQVTWINDFHKSISELYKFGVDSPQGADYVFYVKRYLESRIRKSTIRTFYSNKVIIITDGYLETDSKSSYTPVQVEGLYEAYSSGLFEEFLKRNKLEIPTYGKKFSDVQFLVCEINERKSGLKRDNDILIEYWRHWFNGMGVPSQNQKFLIKEASHKRTLSMVKNFVFKE